MSALFYAKTFCFPEVRIPMPKMIRITLLLVIFLFRSAPTHTAAEILRAASGGFTTAIHGVLWAAYEQKIFRKYGLDVEYLAFNSGRLGMQMLL
jgi:ABC-type nitrate/sulfonate/bicarbonate transport system substrate-binding protein